MVAERRCNPDRSQRRTEILAPRRPAKQVRKPGLSYVIDVHDPIEPVNRALYRFNATFDEYLFLPVTRAYEFITPNYLEDRISGIFFNISEVRNLINSILQLRPKASATVFTRFIINTTLGIGGMWDLRPRLSKHEETLERWAVGIDRDRMSCCRSSALPACGTRPVWRVIPQRSISTFTSQQTWTKTRDGQRPIRARTP
jgi:hypothetical protein